jgi:DNA-binding CsgD family transcriptional regulator
MSGAVALRAGAEPIRVFVSATTPGREAAFARIVAQAGHALAPSAAESDVTLAEIGAPGHAQLVIETGEADGGEAAGLLRADADAAQIDAALRAVAAGLIVRAPDAAETGFHAMDEGDGQKLLTPREVEVLHAIGQGLTNKAIARRLGISLHTVKFHVEAIFRKLGVTTRTGAMAKASDWRRTQTIEL